MLLNIGAPSAMCPDHQEEIDKRIAKLEGNAEKEKEQVVKQDAWEREWQEEQHQHMLGRWAALNSVRETARAEFEAGLRRDKIEEMRQPVEAWPFQFSPRDDAPTYLTSYDWLEAVWVWIGVIKIIMRKPIYGWKRGSGKVPTINGYEARPKQIAYAEHLEKRMREILQETNDAH